jgi:hypothetical protein
MHSASLLSTRTEEVAYLGNWGDKACGHSWGPCPGVPSMVAEEEGQQPPEGSLYLPMGTGQFFMAPK